MSKNTTVHVDGRMEGEGREEGGLNHYSTASELSQGFHVSCRASDQGEVRESVDRDERRRERAEKRESAVNKTKIKRRRSPSLTPRDDN